MVKIGVILNDKGNITSLMDGVNVSVYQFIESRWTIIEEITECFKQKELISQMRLLLNELIASLKDCEVLIGTIITGIPYLILDKAGIMLCESEELSESLLTTVAIDYEKKQQRILEKSNMTCIYEYPQYPYPTGEDGVYELDMCKLQQAHPDISSKKALIPFLKDTKFRCLELYCNHVMPWLDFDLPSRGLTYKKEKLGGDGYKVTIEPKSI